jgi:hypothetical protein
MCRWCEAHNSETANLAEKHVGTYIGQRLYLLIKLAQDSLKVGTLLNQPELDAEQEHLLAMSQNPQAGLQRNRDDSFPLP